MGKDAALLCLLGLSQTNIPASVINKSILGPSFLSKFKMMNGLDAGNVYIFLLIFLLFQCSYFPPNFALPESNTNVLQTEVLCLSTYFTV